MWNINNPKKNELFTRIWGKESSFICIICSKEVDYLSYLPPPPSHLLKAKKKKICKFLHDFWVFLFGLGSSFFFKLHDCLVFSFTEQIFIDCWCKYSLKWPSVVSASSYNPLCDLCPRMWLNLQICLCPIKYRKHGMMSLPKLGYKLGILLCHSLGSFSLGESSCQVRKKTHMTRGQVCSQLCE